MCLVVIASRIRADFPLVVGANRDESFERPAIPMDVLRANAPRVLGGRDELGGGTWLAVNEHGVVASLTNRPMHDGRSLTKRSRGELPLALASHRSAAAAVDALVEVLRHHEYNPVWLVVADPDSLFTLDMTGGNRPAAVEYSAGVHIFENCPPGTMSPKIAHVGSLLADLDHLPEPELVSCLAAGLSSHEVPDACGTTAQPDSDERPAAARAACVHAD